MKGQKMLCTLYPVSHDGCMPIAAITSCDIRLGSCSWGNFHCTDSFTLHECLCVLTFHEVLWAVRGQLAGVHYMGPRHWTRVTMISAFTSWTISLGWLPYRSFKCFNIQPQHWVLFFLILCLTFTVSRITEVSLSQTHWNVRFS